MDKRYKDYYLYRLLEILPGFFVWLTFILAITLSFISPLYGIYFIIAFDVYWILRITYNLIFLVLSWFKYRKESQTDWWNALNTKCTNWQDYYHIIFLPTAGEPWEVVDNTFQKLSQVRYNHHRMILVLAGEERFKDDFEPIAKKIKEKYNNKFKKIIVTLHPADIPGEVKGKGSNMYHAAHEAKKYVDTNNFDYKKIIVSSFDIDTVTHPDYFAYLTYKFITHPNPYRASFQPMAFFHNNVWQSDIITRVVANSTTFWLLTDMARPDRLFTFSSHSMSWQALIDVGFWQNNIVTEDSRIFLQCFIHYDGDYKVEPMYIPVSMNTVYVGTFWRSMINQYKQMTRWAYGVEHFAYMVWHFRKCKKMPASKKWIYIWNQTEGVYSWATAPILITIMGYLPLYLAEKQAMTNVLAQNAPLILEKLMHFGMFGLIVIATMSVVILPPMPSNFKNKKYAKYYRYVMMFVQWLIFPFTMVLFGSIPAVDSQTRLMLGKYLGFWVTEKKKID